MNDFVQALSKQKKKESPARTPRETIRFYATFSFSLIAISGFSVLMFLVPFIVDPALATLTADFVEKPVECRVIFSRAILGNQKYLASFLQVCNMQICMWCNVQHCSVIIIKLLMLRVGCV